MNYETPEVIEIGRAEEVVLGSLKDQRDDGNVTGFSLDVVDEDIE